MRPPRRCPGLGNITAAAVRGATIAEATPLQADGSDEHKTPATADAVAVIVQISRDVSDANPGLQWVATRRPAAATRWGQNTGGLNE